MVGAQDELVFDGNSLVLDDEGELVARAASFEEELLVVDLDPASTVGHRLRDVAAAVRSPPASARSSRRPRCGCRRRAPRPTPCIPGRAPADLTTTSSRCAARSKLGLRDYVVKNGFAAVVVAVSGGIDSALPAALAVTALGPGRVHVVSMPSQFSSAGTRKPDVERLGRALEVDFREIPIEPIVEAFTTGLAPSFAGREPDLTEENLQARVRGTLLMGLSNKFGWLVIATGNKSELSVGYSTLYGDGWAGGVALLQDVYKTDVFRLSSRLNEDTGRELIPRSIIDRAPSAELRADQRDEDSLPPYSKLDGVLEAYVELDRSRDELAEDGFDPEVVERAIAMIDRAEYKRRQAPPGVKLRPKAFGRDRRTPITNRWTG